MKNARFKLLILILILFLTACNGKKDDTDKIKDSAKINDKAEADTKQGVGSGQASDNLMSAHDKNISNNGVAGSKNNLSARGKLVKGAEKGSLSDHVEDMEIWNDISDEDFKKVAMDPISGIHLPRILLDSEDAKSANKQIEEIAASLKKEYEDLVNLTGNKDVRMSASFSAYEDDKILSLYLELPAMGDEPAFNCKIFNFSLDDGKFIGDEDLLLSFGIGKEEVMDLMEESISRQYEEMIDQYYSNLDNYIYMGDVSNYEGMALNDLWDGKEIPEKRFYIDPMGCPVFLCHSYFSFGESFYLNKLKLQTRPMAYSKYSNDFVRIAREMGLDPADEKIKAFILYLGSAQDESKMQNVLEKLYPYQAMFNDYEDPRILLPIKDNENYPNGELIGDDFYLIVPRWGKASVSARELTKGDDGNLKEIDNHNLDDLAQRSTTLICQRQDEKSTNLKLSIRYREEKIDFTPKINQNNEIIDLPEGIQDMGKMINWDNAVKEDYYSLPLLQKILSVMGRG